MSRMWDLTQGLTVHLLVPSYDHAAVITLARVTGLKTGRDRFLSLQS